MLRFCANIIVLLWLSLLTAALVEVHREPDSSTLQAATGPDKGAPPNLLERMEQGIFRKNAQITLGEAEVNRYLSQMLVSQQTGAAAAASHVKFENVALNFEEDLCRVVFSWKTAEKYTSKASLAFTIQRKENQFIIEPISGSLGRLNVPRGFVTPLIPALKSLCKAMENEIHTVFQMNQIQFQKDQVVLDPRSATSPE